MTDKSFRSTAALITGSVGEHLAVAHLLGTFVWDERISSMFSNIEVFHVDRGTDIGIDFIVRLHVRSMSKQRNFNFLIGIQVKNFRKKHWPKKLPPAKMRFLETFPGPVLLLLYTDRAKQVRIDDWLELNKPGRRKKLESDKWIGTNRGTAYVKAIRERVAEECGRYILSESLVEKQLYIDNTPTAMSTAELLNRLAPKNAAIRLLKNRVMIRSARWKLQLYAKARKHVDGQRRRRRPGLCPSYNGYCIHYQAALVRDEALRSRKWLGREYASIRKELVIAFRSLFPDRVRNNHDDETKARLYRYGLGVVALIIMLDLAQGSSTHLGEWKEWDSDLRRMVGEELEKSVLKEDSLSLYLGPTYRSFVDLATGEISQKKVEKWAEKRQVHLDKRTPNRDPDEDAVVHFLGAGLWMKAGDVKAASTEVDRATAIARVQKKSLWIHPVRYVSARIEYLKRQTDRRPTQKGRLMKRTGN